MPDSQSDTDDRFPQLLVGTGGCVGFLLPSEKSRFLYAKAGALYFHDASILQCLSQSFVRIRPVVVILEEYKLWRMLT
jgi:hypothetical protein